MLSGDAVLASHSNPFEPEKCVCFWAWSSRAASRSLPYRKGYGFGVIALGVAARGVIALGVIALGVADRGGQNSSLKLSAAAKRSHQHQVHPTLYISV